MIRDLEELLLRVPDLDSREFMKEAVRCYQAGAYRASVVMAVSAGMDDLRRKLNRLASSGASSHEIATAAQFVEKQFQAQLPFEKGLIAAASSGVGFITPSEQKKLDALLTTRNLNAHPSGHRSSAEEARDAIASIIDIVLSRPGLMGAVAAKSLVARVQKPAFYPELSSAEQAFPVVAAEVESIAPDSLRVLAATIMDEVVARLASVGDSRPRGWWIAGKSHALEPIDALVLFLGGMLRISGPCEDAASKQLPRLVQEAAASDAVCWLLSVNPAAVRHLSALDRDRAIGFVKRASDRDINAARTYDEWARLKLLELR